MRKIKYLIVLLVLAQLTSCIPPRYTHGKNVKNLVNVFRVGDWYENKFDSVLEKNDGQWYHMSNFNLGHSGQSRKNLPRGSKFKITRVYKSFSGSFGYDNHAEVRIYFNGEVFDAELNTRDFGVRRDGVNGYHSFFIPNPQKVKLLSRK